MIEQAPPSSPTVLDRNQEISPDQASRNWITDSATSTTPIPEKILDSGLHRERASPYLLRIREPKRQWEESMQSTSDISEPHEPKTLKDAITSPDTALWKNAVQDEYDSLINNKTWTLTKLPLNPTAIRSRWIFKVKSGVHGSTPRQKARLVAKGYLQRPGIDCEETFAPVAKQNTLRGVLYL